MSKHRALICFKQDLRMHDPPRWVAAQAHIDALALVVIEPKWLQSLACDASDVDLALKPHPSWATCSPDTPQ